MSHNIFAKPGYTSLSHDEQQAEMSYPRLGVLLSILGVIWILCYNAEQQFPARHNIQTYSRIGEQQVTKQSYKFAVDLLASGPNSDAGIKHQQFISKKYSITKELEQNICILLIHKNGEQKWMKSVETLLTQSYTNYKIFYFNNYKAGQEVYQYLNKNSLNKSKFKLIQDIEDTDYSKEFEYAKNYCEADDIVIYMRDDDCIIGNTAFAVINSIFNQKRDLKLLYTGSLVAQNQGKSKKVMYRLGKTFEYPSDVVKKSNFRHYPFLLDGLIAFKGQLLDLIDTSNMLNSEGEPYQEAGEIIFGINLLELAGEHTMYLPELLLYRGNERFFVGSDSVLRKQIIAISNSKDKTPDDEDNMYG